MRLPSGTTKHKKIPRGLHRAGFLKSFAGQAVLSTCWPVPDGSAALVDAFTLESSWSRFGPAASLVSGVRLIVLIVFAIIDAELILDTLILGVLL
jgi:hypothetical protein